jgi:hypothetical protein
MLFNKALRAIWSCSSRYGPAFIAVALMLFAEIFPPIKDYHQIYLAICLSAIVWILIDIKFDLEEERERKGPDTIAFKSIREARPKVMASLLREIQRPHVGQVLIVGGRLRSVIEFLRELGAHLEAANASSQSGCNIDILVMKPDLVGSMIMPGDISEAQQKDRQLNTAQQMITIIKELKILGENSIFLKNKVCLRSYLYEGVPFGFYYIFGEEEILFGGYCWDRSQSDIIGPNRPCWLVTRRSPEFQSMLEWLRNRADLYEAQTSLNSKITPVDQPYHGDHLGNSSILGHVHEGSTNA